jgi:hypothetical protein
MDYEAAIHPKTLKTDQKILPLIGGKVFPLIYCQPMLLIILAMITGSSLTAFSLPAASSTNSSLSGLRLTPQKPSGDAPFTPSPTLSSPSLDPTKPAQRGSLLNLSV